MSSAPLFCHPVSLVSLAFLDFLDFLDFLVFSLLDSSPPIPCVPHTIIFDEHRTCELVVISPEQTAVTLPYVVNYTFERHERGINFILITVSCTQHYERDVRRGDTRSRREVEVRVRRADTPTLSPEYLKIIWFIKYTLRSRGRF